MGRTKNTLKIMYSNIILQVTIAVCGFILPGLMINEYGSEVNGLVSTVKQLLTYFSIVSLGLASSSSVALYKPLAEKDFNKVSRILSATRIFFNRTGYLFITLISITTIILPLISKNSNLKSLEIGSIVLICGIGSILEYILISKYKILITADQKLYILAYIQSQGVIINTILSILLIKLHMSIVMVQLVSTFGYVLRLCMIKKYINKNYTCIDFKADPDFESIKNRWEAFSYQISGMVITYTPIIIIAVVCGFNDASIYSVYNMVFSSVAMIVGIFSSGFVASFGHLIIENNTNLLRRSFSSFEFIFNIALFFCYTCALILILPFLNVYIKSSDNINYILPGVALFFTLSGLFKAIRTPSITLVEATGRFKDNNKANILEAITNIIISLVLAKYYGIVGILIASTITSLIRSLMYIHYTSKYILINKLYKRIIKLIINFTFMISIFILSKGSIPNCSSFIDWIKISIIISISCLIIFILLNCMIDYKSAKDVFLRLLNLAKHKYNKLKLSKRMA